MRYIIATHTGKGFYTHQDRSKMTFFRYIGGIVICDGDCNDWIKRVKGKEITETEANNRLKQQFEIGKTKEIAEKEKELSEVKNKVYDFKSFTIH